MKHIRLSKKYLIVALISLATLFTGGVIVTQFVVPQFSESPGDIIRRTNTSDYSELSKEDINARSKAKFGKSINRLSASDIEKSTNKEEYGAALYEAARLLSAAGNVEKSVQMYEVAHAERKDAVDQDFYRDYRNTLDDAGRHSEGTELMRQQLGLLKKQSPIDEIAIARVESQISEREEYYK